jgi:outer membrane biosynthesis protein TonB
MEDLTREEQGNRKKGLIFSVVFHTMAIILLGLYGFTFQNPPPEPGGILVNLGIPDVGQGDENAPISEPAPAVEEEEEEPVAEEEPEPEKKPEPAKETPKAEPKKEVVKTEDPEAIALKKKKEEEKKKADAEARKKAEEERKRKEAEAAAEAKRRAEEAEKKRKQEELAGAIGDALGKGKGNTGKPGNQGDPNGDPNSDILTGISTGSGVVGGGLGNRGIEKRGPAIKDSSQEKGTVFLDVCVDKNGNVISAEYTQKGSTTNSTRLKQLAIQNAKAWKFSKGSVDKQCGTIRYDFKLR